MGIITPNARLRRLLHDIYLDEQFRRDTLFTPTQPVSDYGDVQEFLDELNKGDKSGDAIFDYATVNGYQPGQVANQIGRSQEVQRFTEQMSKLLNEDDASLGSALKTAASGPTGPVKDALQDIIAKVLSGDADLNIAMAQHPDVFDPLYCNCIRGGEINGNVEKAFEVLATS